MGRIQIKLIDFIVSVKIVKMRIVGLKWVNKAIVLSFYLLTMKSYHKIKCKPHSF